MNIRTQLFPLAALLFACAANTVETPETDGPGDIDNLTGKADSSAHANFINMEFDASLITTSAFDTFSAKARIENQLLFTIGHLNGSKAVGRLDTAELSNVQITSLGGGRQRVNYHAKLPVAWSKQNTIPASYRFILPLDNTYTGIERFTESYKESCVDFGAHDVDSGSIWYYYRPNRSDCEIADTDIVVANATVTRSPTETTGKYPEYTKVWEDNALRVVAIFGKYEDGATTASDAGVAAYNSFVAAVRRSFSNSSITTTPAAAPTSPGVGTPDITFRIDLGAGRTAEIVALLVDNVREGGPAFETRYETLSSNADLIAYNGHAGLGTNVRFLANRGTWQQGQYAIVFMNGCDTFAYIDNALWEAHAEVNPDDALGTQYVDIVTNAMPAFFSYMPDATMQLITALSKPQAPLTYEQIFARITSTQIVLVTGEQDNTFTPGGTGGGGGGGGTTWAGLNETATVARSGNKKYATGVLQPGTYEFKMTGTGDADLYARIGADPSTRLYDCRPYDSTSNEVCTLQLTTAADIRLMVRGYSAATFTLTGSKK